MNFIDIHCHILPGIDDGPVDMRESVEMARMAIDDGISTIFATPHIMDGVYDNTTLKIKEAYGELLSSLPAGITLLCGADVRISPDMIKKIERGDIPTLHGSGYLLIELPHFVIPPSMNDFVFNLKQRGMTPILTHPERHLLLSKNLTVLKSLRSFGAMIQITAQSIIGGFGRDIRKASISMLKEGLVDFVASDAHNLRKRPPQLSAACRQVEALFGDETARRLFALNQKQIVGAIESAETTLKQ
ncbi:MAG TPA: capsule biosynthesis protein CapC [Nitrospiraceae bacterium]|nr:capsule biosynthesis protein CapC [Nitrospiraceae bacterium]